MLIKCILLVLMASLFPSLLAQRIEKSWPTLRFSGINWAIKTYDEAMGPGHNLFGLHPRNVFIDKKGRLHLNIRKTKQGWSCAELVAQRPMAEGVWEIEIESDLSAFKHQAVLGLFLYDEDAQPHHNEIDIEFSRWGVPDSLNGQFVLHKTNGIEIMRFKTPMGKQVSKHQIIVTKDSIVANSVFLTPPQKQKPFGTSHVFHRSDYYNHQNSRFRINYWLYNHQQHKGRCRPVVIRSISFNPL
jgi:hypothetical protein